LGFSPVDQALPLFLLRDVQAELTTVCALRASSRIVDLAVAPLVTAGGASCERGDQHVS